MHIIVRGPFYGRYTIWRGEWPEKLGTYPGKSAAIKAVSQLDWDRLDDLMDYDKETQADRREREQTERLLDEAEQAEGERLGFRVLPI